MAPPLLRYPHFYPQPPTTAGSACALRHSVALACRNTAPVAQRCGSASAGRRLDGGKPALVTLALFHTAIPAGDVALGDEGPPRHTRTERSLTKIQIHGKPSVHAPGSVRSRHVRASSRHHDSRLPSAIATLSGRSTRACSSCHVSRATLTRSTSAGDRCRSRTVCDGSATPQSALSWSGSTEPDRAVPRTLHGESP